jgi:hypothetical protein
VPAYAEWEEKESALQAGAGNAIAGLIPGELSERERVTERTLCDLIKTWSWETEVFGHSAND